MAETAGAGISCHKVWLWALTLVIFCTSTLAKERLLRKYDQFTGQPALPANSIAQDADGFLWVGTVGGLMRFDGRDMLPWARNQLPKAVVFLFSSPRGEVFVLPDLHGSLFRITPSGVEPVEGPGGKPLQGVRDVQFSSDSTMYVAIEGALHIRTDRWTTVHLPPGAKGGWLDPGINNTALYSTTAGIFRVRRTGQLERLKDGWFDAAAELGDGTLYLSQREDHPNGWVRLLRVRNGQETLVHRWIDQRPRFLLRGDRLWVIATYLLAVVSPDGSLDRAVDPETPPHAAAGIVDREGSVWVAHTGGLLQFPEPDVELWYQSDGLLPGALHVAETNEGLWISAWPGLSLLKNGARRFEKVGGHVGNLCVDGAGTFWAGTPRLGGKFKSFSHYRGGYLCMPSRDGSLWVGAPGLFRTSKSEDEPQAAPMPSGYTYPTAVLEDSRERLWLAHGERLCWAPAAKIQAGVTDAWECTERPGCRSILTITEMPSGALWMGTFEDGLWSFDGKTWNRVPGSVNFPSRSVTRLIPSRRKGVWILSPGLFLRVEEKPHSSDGFEIVERLTSWHGLSALGGDILERADGSLWITSRGVTFIPAHVRDQRLPRPPLRLTETRLDDVPVTSPPQSIAAKHKIEIGFAALTYRDRTLLRHEYRLTDSAPWQPLRSSESPLRLINLNPGDYAISLRASLDGADWSELDRPIRFRVVRPWYLRAPAIVLYILVVASILLAAHLLRVRFLLSVERERRRIAMDLHDELGSGLGSIGILSGLAAAQETSDAKRREFSANIATTAAELSVALTEILWTLRPGHADLADLMQRMVRRAESLFPGDSPRFEFRRVHGAVLPELQLSTRRSLALIVDEALHNAAKHSGAEHVTLSLASFPLDEWEISVEDDGLGLRNGSSGNGGMGLENMRQRAASIDARVWLDRPEDPGCRVRIRFKATGPSPSSSFGTRGGER